MTGARYIALIDVEQAAAEDVHRLALEARQSGLVTALESPRLLVLVSPQTPTTPIGSHGIAVGDVFARDSKAAGTLPEAVAASGGRLLATDYWGDHVAFLDAPAEPAVRVLRSPSGGIAAFRAHRDGVVAITSDALLLVELGFARPVIDWTFVANHLAFPHLRGARTGLADVDELFAGDCTAFAPTGTSTLNLWTPWQFAAPERRIDDAGEAADTLRAVVEQAVTWLCRRYPRILVELSGGLDSSIVASMLAKAGADITCLNLVTPTAEGDERGYARAVAAAAGVHLDEAFPDPDADLLALPHTRLARPGLPGVLGPWEAKFIDLAHAIGASAFFGGTGGDNVFCSLASAAPAIDRLAARGWGAGVVRTMADVAAVNVTGLWPVLQRTWAGRKARPPRERWPRENLFIAEDAIPEAPPLHPWLVEPSWALPGTRGHVRSIMAVAAHVDGYARHAVAPSVFPLLAQPVVETCLRIPSWMWVDGGRDRSVARRAFAGLVPAPVLSRRTKGMMNGYCATLYRTNRQRIRERLLDGHLANTGMIERASLDAYLADAGPIAGISFYRVLSLVDVDVWLASWLG